MYHVSAQGVDERMVLLPVRKLKVSTQVTKMKKKS